MAFKILTALVCCALLSAATVHGRVTGRIIGGAEAEQAQFPYTVSVRVMTGHVCGGAIISDRFVLTAAHCVVNDDLEAYSGWYLSVRVGTNNRRTGGMEVGVAKVTLHSNYTGQLADDIAIIELDESLVFSSTIQPIELAKEEVPEGSDVTISGWGKVVDDNTNDIPLELKFNTLSAKDSLECSKIDQSFTEKILCLAHEVGNGTCNGDSGGPAVYDGKLVGVAGYILNTCGSESPDGYAKVSAYIDWIQSVTGQ